MKLIELAISNEKSRFHTNKLICFMITFSESCVHRMKRQYYTYTQHINVLFFLNHQSTLIEFHIIWLLIDLNELLFTVCIVRTYWDDSISNECVANNKNSEMTIDSMEGATIPLFHVALSSKSIIVWMRSIDR